MTVAEETSLAAVAARIYGSTAAVDRLWNANRDQLPTRDSPIHAGMLLRTP